jgi:hypothetical protein
VFVQWHRQRTANLPHPPFTHNLANRIVIAVRPSNVYRIVRARRVPPALEKYICQCLCLFCLSAMPLPLSLCPYQDSWPGYQPRFVPPTSHPTIHSTLCFRKSLSHRPCSSCDRHVIHGPVHSNCVCVVLLDDHLTFLIGRPFLQLIGLFHHVCCLGRGLLDLDEPVHCWA